VEQRRQRPRIADVAIAAGVSKTAVSFAFNNPERLAPETVARIREVAEGLGYRPHPVARMLSQRRTRTVGVVVPQALSVVFSNPFIGAFSEGVARVVEDAGYGLMFISPLHGSLAQAIGRATVDGVVAIGLSAHHPEIEHIRRSGLPMVVVDSSPLPGVPSIEVDDEGGARAAAEHLLALGHREFLILAVEPPPPATPQDPEGVLARRLAGYRAAAAAYGLEIPAAAIVVAPATIDGGAAAFQRAWARGERPTAVLAMSDAMAIGAMRAAADLGLAIPGDVSVVGFDDIDLARQVHPALTTVHQPVRRKGEEAVRLLLSLLGDRDRTPVRRQLETRLIVRASTGPAPGPTTR
jgi:alanine racemase